MDALAFLSPGEAMIRENTFDGVRRSAHKRIIPLTHMLNNKVTRFNLGCEDFGPSALFTAEADPR